LGKEDLALPFGFKTSESVMRVVGQSLSEPSPADHAARPVTSTRQFLDHERLNEASCPV
jgi:hypothetical protein